MSEYDFAICERYQGISRHDNDISYHIASIEVGILTAENKILLRNTSSIQINMVSLISVLKTAWEFNDNDVTKI